MFKQQSLPAAPARREPPPGALEFAPPARRAEARSEAYAAAMNDFRLMENETQVLRQEIAKANAEIAVLEESNKLLHRDMDGIKADNERLVRENTVIHTRLRAAADTLLGVMKPADPSRPTEAEAAGMAAVEGELAGP